MNPFTRHAVKVCEAADRADANFAMEARGWGPDTYSVPCGPPGGPVTHYAGIGPETEEDIAVEEDIKLPGPKSPPGLTTAHRDAVRRSQSDRLTNEAMAEAGMSDRQHFDAVLEARGLVELAPEPEVIVI